MVHEKLIFRKMPGVFSSCLRIIFLRRNGFKPGDNLLPIKAVMANITVDKKKLKEYIDICGLKDDGNLPLLYPHVFTAPMQMAIVSHRNFPVSCLGILHYRNHIIRHRPIGADEILNIEVELTEHRIVRQGLESDYIIKVKSGDELVWESITTYMKKGRFGSEYRNSPNSDLIQPMTAAGNTTDLFIPENIGRKYAKICSDYNPIHLSKTIARLLGYRKRVAHAMWAVANGMSVLPEPDPAKTVRVDLIFKGPLFVGSKSHLKTEKTDDSTRFDYYCGDNPRPGISGKVSYVKKGTRLF